MPKISIIVPVYNVENYLNCCIDSILVQTFSDFELLLVNDGSTDSSGEICDEYAQKDSRVRVFHKINGGVSSARNVGLSYANGIWVAFVDSDDSVEDCFLSSLIELEEEDVDIIIAGTATTGILLPTEFVNCLLEKSIPVALWGKLIRKNIILSSLDIPREIYYGEDMIANIAIGLNSRGKIVCISKNFYNYRNNMESVSHNRKVDLKYEELFLDAVEKLLCTETKIYDNGLNKLRLASLELLVVCKKRISYKKTPWIVSLRKWASTNSLSIRQKIVIGVSNNVLCRYLLALERRLTFLK